MCLMTEVLSDGEKGCGRILCYTRIHTKHMKGGKIHYVKCSDVNITVCVCVCVCVCVF